MPCLICLAGPAGAGKSTFGFQLADYLKSKGLTVIVLDDDAARREICNRPLKQSFLPTDYRDEVSRQVIEVMRQRMEAALKSDCHVINTSGYWSERSRNYVENLARYNGAEFIGFWLTAPEHVLEDRLDRRAHERQALVELKLELGHASDADKSILKRYPPLAFESVNWLPLNTNREPKDVMEDVVAQLRGRGLLC